MEVGPPYIDSMKRLRDIDIKNKRVFVRCDFNVSVDERGNITDDFRIIQTLPTLKYLLKNKVKLVLASHFADGQSLEPVWKRVKKLIGDKDITFLENLRFNKGEEENSDQYAKELASLADVYINDAFGVCHRAHASVVGIPKYLPSAAGFLLEKEVSVLSQIMENPDRPFVAIIGGVKFESKAKVIDSFLKVADYLLVGGKIGLSQKVKQIQSDKLVLPIDDVDTFDIGPESIKMFVEKIKIAKTIIWAGPIGLFEKEPYNIGTKMIGKAIVKNKKAFKVAGGGDTVSAINKFKLQKKFDHLSTGGGAMLEFLAGETLPGLEALGYYN
jgi:3-phosphoglycerate kinase